MMSKRAPRVVAVVVLVVVSVLTLPDGLPNDIRYEIGAKAVSPFGPAGTFTHRPLLYRLFTSAVFAPAHFFGRRGALFEFFVRGEAVALAAVASVLLWAGLRRCRPEVAVPVAVAVFAAQVLMNPAFTFEPEWLATTLTVAAVGAGLMFRRIWVGASAAGVLFVAATAVKIVSLPIAIIGLLALVILDRRRAIGATVAAAVFGGAYLLGLATLFPREITWLLDMQTVQPLPPPPGVERALMSSYAENIVVMWPAVALLPAALVGARWRLKAAVVAALVLGWLPAQIQQHFYIYHAAALPVVAAAAVGAAVAVRRPRPAQAVGVIGYSVWIAVLMAMSKSVRISQAPIWFAVTAVFAVAAWWSRRDVLRQDSAVGEVIDRRRLAGTALMGGCLVALTTVPMSLPVSAESLSMPASSIRTELTRERSARLDIRAARKIHARIGKRTPVTYLTFGDKAYYLGNPTTCRYPSPVFLQRSRHQHNQEGTTAWHETLDCLNDPGRWLVWDVGWFTLKGEPGPVVDLIHRQFDCRHGFHAPDQLLVCPRATAGGTSPEDRRPK